MRKIVAYEAHPYNTDPEAYSKNLSAVMSQVLLDGLTPSNRVVKALQSVYPGVRTVGFKKAVLKAIYEDACGDVPKEWRDKYLRRLKRWTGPGYLKHFYERFEILAAWKERYAVVPDAYLIDPVKKTVVCFEVEDHHHLKPRKIACYGGA